MTAFYILIQLLLIRLL